MKSGLNSPDFKDLFVITIFSTGSQEYRRIHTKRSKGPNSQFRLPEVWFVKHGFINWIRAYTTRKEYGTMISLANFFWVI